MHTAYIRASKKVGETSAKIIECKDECRVGMKSILYQGH